MKRTRAQNPKVQDAQDPSAPAPANPKPQRKAKQPRQPKAAAGTGGKKASAAAAAREAAAAAAAVSASSSSTGAETSPVVPDVAAGVEVAGGLPADWDEMDGALGSNGSPWWTFGVEEEKLTGWFPFVEEDFGGCHGTGGGRAGGAGEPEPAAFDDDIWRIHQIYEIPSYAAK